MDTATSATCVVMDVGSATIKAQMAGAEAPRFFQNVTGTLKHNAAIPQQHLEGLINQDTLAGNDVAKHRGLLRLAYPMTSGHVTDWAGLTYVMRSVEAQLQVKPRETTVLVTEPPHTSRPQREALAERLFEDFQHPSAMFAVQGLLSLYATGNTTGVVLDVGDGVTQACPVVEGYSIRDAVRRADTGGRDVTLFLQHLLRLYGTYLDTSAELELVRQIKEQRCSVSKTPLRGLEGDANAARSRYRLPDGGEVTLGPELSLAPEVLFNPTLMGRETSGVATLLSESIKRCDIDLRKSLYESVVLVGGSTLCSHFPGRLLTDFSKLTPRDCHLKMIAPPERLTATWIGGSFLSQVSSFTQLVVRKSDYAEEGARVIHARLLC